MSALATVIAPIHRAGWPFIAAFAAITALFATFSSILFWIGVIATLWCVYFFRDPSRTVPQREGLILSPADGRVSMITMAPPPPELDMDTAPLLRISIFLNIFNVHVNRAPAAGTIVLAAYHPGKFLSASLDKASEVNERMAIRYRLHGGREIVFVQIAGLVARRIVTSVINGQALEAGERYGLIRFGSRVDVYLSPDIQPLVAVGQTAIGGETVLADLTSAEPARIGATL